MDFVMKKVLVSSLVICSFLAVNLFAQPAVKNNTTPAAHPAKPAPTATTQPAGKMEAKTEIKTNENIKKEAVVKKAKTHKKHIEEKTNK